MADRAFQQVLDHRAAVDLAVEAGWHDCRKLPLGGSPDAVRIGQEIVSAKREPRAFLDAKTGSLPLGFDSESAATDAAGESLKSARTARVASR